jgi:hypothetical protein
MTHLAYEDEVLGRRISSMPTPYPLEFHRDMIAVPRQREQSREQIAAASGSPPPAWPAGYGSLTARTRPLPAPARRQAVTSRSSEVAPSPWTP